jgi:hemolysin activation/secretion protein
MGLRGVHLAGWTTGVESTWPTAVARRVRVIMVGLCLLVASSTGAMAQRVPIPSTAEPGAVERSIPLQQIPQSSGQDLRVPTAPPTKAPSGAESVLFTVNEIQIVGATALSPEQLADTYSDLVGTKISLSELYGVANAITAKYAAAGYALCFALVPAQQIKNGVIRIQVIEGFVARIVLENKHPDVPPSVAAYGWRLLHSRPLRTADLEHYLLLANDIPGYTVKAVFDRLPDRDAAPGATQLILHIERRVADGTITADNRGSRTLGSTRGDAFVSLRSMFGWGEEIQLHTLQSVDPGLLNYYSGLFSLPVDGEGTRITESLSYSSTLPNIAALGPGNFRGTTLIANWNVEHPLLRSRANSWWVSAGFTAKKLDGSVLDVPDSEDHIYVANAATTYMTNADTSTTYVHLTVNQGLPVFGATTSTSPLRSRASGSGVYTSVVLDLARRQDIWGPFDTLTTFNGQWASRGLLASEQCAYGGATYGRAFDDSELVGDECIMGSEELRFSPFALMGGQPHILPIFQLYGFYDAGIVWESGELLSGEKQSEVGQSFGGGLRVGLSIGLSASVEYAQPLTPDVADNGSRRGRIFASLKQDL